MNKRCYRLVFNARRGQIMAVAESAHVRSGTPGDSGSPPGIAVNPAAPARHAGRALATAALLAAAHFGLAAPACAQVVAARSAPASQQPTVFDAGNGALRVDVQSPSASGVSHNTYSQFDVQATGVVLNNSRKGANTQLAGQIPANPWMAKGTAKVILNEVVSGNSSQLRGMIEVGGDKAEVVVANPVGVVVDGGGFINASSATVTTGKPAVRGGNLEGYVVERGKVTVGAGGLDASQSDYAAIVARAVEVNGAIHAKELKVLTGANKVSADLSRVTPIEGKGAAPAYALDVAELGGMYAGKITLVGTEAGVGVRNAGRIAASAGELRITTEGLLVNQGQIVSAGDAALRAASGIANRGSVYGRGAVKAITRGNIDTSGVIAAQGDATLSAVGEDSEIRSTGDSLLMAGVAPDGELGGTGSLRLTATRAISANGVNMAAGSLEMTSPVIILTGSETLALLVRLDALPNPRRPRERRAQAQSLPVGGSTDDQATSAGDATVAQGEAGEGTLRTDGARVVADGIVLTAAQIDNTGGSLQSAGDLVVSSAGVLDNSTGHLSAGGSLAVFDPSGDTDPAAKTLAIVNSGGSLTAGKAMMLDAARLGLDGQIVSRGDFAAALQGDYVHGAAPDFYQASGSVSLAFTGTLYNDTAWHVGAGLSLAAGQIVNGPSGQISSDATTVVQAVSGALTNRGSIHGNTVAALGRELDNRGGHITGNTLAAEFSGNADNRQGRIDFTGAADVYVGGNLDNDGGRIDTGSLALAVVGNLTSRTATEQTAYRSADRDRSAGRRLGWGETLVTQTIPGPRAGITARTGDLTLDVGGDLVVQSADLTAAGDLGGYVAGEIGVSAAALASHTHVQSINAGSSWAESGFNAETYSRTESSVEHLPAEIRVGGDLSLIAGGGASYQGSDVSAGGNLTLGAVRGNLQIAASRNTRHAESTRIGEDSSETTTDSASLAGGRLDAGGDLRLLAGADLALSGVDASAGGQLWAVAGHNLSAASLPIVTTTTIHTQSAEAPSGEDESWRNSTPAETTSTRTTTTQHGGHFSAPEGIVFDAGHGNPFASAPAAASAPTGASAAAASGDLTLTGVALDGGVAGDIELRAAGNLSLLAAWDHSLSATQAENEWSSPVARWFANLYPASGPVVTVSQATGSLRGANVTLAAGRGDLTVGGMNIAAGADLNLASGADTTIDSSTLAAGRDLAVSADGRLDVQGLVPNPTLAPPSADTLNNHFTPTSTAATLSAAQRLTLIGTTGVAASGLDLRAPDITVLSEGGLAIRGASLHEEWGPKNDHHVRNHARASTLVGERVTLAALGDASPLTLAYVDITTTGTTRLAATGDLRLDPGSDFAYDYRKKSHTSGTFVEKTTTTVRQSTRTTIAPSRVQAGEIDLAAGGNLTLTATALVSQGDTSLSAGGDIATLAAWHQSEETKQSHTRRSFFGFDYSHSSETHQRETHDALATSVQSQADVLSGSGQDTTLVGTRIVSATGEVRLQAGRHLTILPAEDSLHEEHHSTSWDLVAGDTLSRHVDDARGETLTTPRGALIAGRQVSLTSGADTHLVGAQILGPEGVEVLAGGSLLIEAASQTRSRYHEHRESGLSLSLVTTAGRPHWIGLNWNQQSTRTQADASAAHPAQLTSTAGNLTLASGGDLAVLGGQLAAAGDIVLAAGQRLILAGAMEGASSQRRDEQKTFIFHQRDGTDERWEQSHVVASQLQASGRIGLTAGEALQLGAVQITSGAATTLDAPDVQFLAEADTASRSRTAWDTDRFYEVHKGEGRIEQTLTLAKIDARGGLNLPAAARVAVQLDGRLAGQDEGGASAAHLRAFARQLSAQPGLGYLAGLAERPDVDWQALASAHEHWDYKTQGLTQEGAIVVAVAVAIVTYGAASTALSGAAATSTTTTTAAAGGATAGTASTAAVAGTAAAAVPLSATNAALAAGISSLASQAAVSFLNNNGNLGKTLHDLGSSQTVKNVVVAMLTAGLTNAELFDVGGKTLSLNQIAGISAIPGAGSVAQSSGNTFGQNLLGVAGRGLVSAGVSTAIQGGSFGEALRDSVVGDLAAMGAGAIGSQWGSGPNKNVALQTLAHAGLGCAAAAARDKDCAAGALGGAAESVLGNLVTLPTGENGGYGTGTRALYTVGAMLAADVLSDGVGVDSLTAMDAARNAALNNRLLHPDEEKWLRDNAKRFAAKMRITENEALERLTQQALKDADYLWRAQLGDGEDSDAKGFLADTLQTFTNDLGEQQRLFTVTGQQLFRPEMYGDQADVPFYKQFAQTGIRRDLTPGLAKELRDSGIAFKNEAGNLLAVARDNPGLVLEALWSATKELPGTLVDNFSETGYAIGEGAAVALSSDIGTRLNAIYGTDVSAYQVAMLGIRTLSAVAGAGGVAKVGGDLSEATAKALGKKLEQGSTDGAAAKTAFTDDVSVTAGGTADSATGARLAEDLAAAQAKDPRIGTTLPGANAPVTVTAESNIGGWALFDTNQTARPAALADPNKPTLIADLVPPGKPNSTMKYAHAEVGLVQQAYDAGFTQGQSMIMVVRGEAVCTYCRASTNLVAAADRAGLNRLEVVDTTSQITYVWTRGSKGFVEK